MSSLRTAAALSFVIAGTGNATVAQAASVRAGDAVQIVHDVKGRQAGNQDWDAKSKGDDVYENEVIRSAVESEAKIYLLDRTALSMGPTSLIRVDRIVNNPDRSIKCVIVSVGGGTVRWTSGDSHRYRMKTPTATVEPIGTVFDLFVDDQRTFVILRQGRVRVCSRDPQPKCKMLGSPGEMILATAGQLQGPGRGAPAPADFVERCLSATGRDCVMNLTYSPPPAPRRNDDPAFGPTARPAGRRLWPAGTAHDLFEIPPPLPPRASAGVHHGQLSGAASASIVLSADLCATTDVPAAVLPARTVVRVPAACKGREGSMVCSCAGYK